VQNKSEIPSFKARDYSCLRIGYMFSRARCVFYTFPRFFPNTRFQALAAYFTLSSAFVLIDVFPRFLPSFSSYCRMFFPPLAMISRSSRRLHDFLQLILPCVPDKGA